jgi:hypothetical protein
MFSILYMFCNVQMCISSYFAYMDDDSSNKI